MTPQTCYKTALTAIFLFFTLAAHCQSEQETLTWLSQKLTTYVKPHGGVYGGVGFTNLKVTSVEPCAITITFEQKQLMRNKLLCTITVVFPTDGIGISDRGIIQYHDDVIAYTSVSASSTLPPKTKYLNSTPDFFIEEGEAGLIGKIQQALHQSAAFCPKK
jgi:hypothetical protein